MKEKEFKIEKDVLQKALEIAKPALATKEIIEQSTSFAFVKGTVITYDDEISITHPIEGFPITGSVKAEEMYKFLSKVRTKEITVSQKENALILKSGRSKVGFSLAAKVLIPLEKEILEMGKWHKIPEKFIKAIGFTAETCSKDMSNPKLTCVHINKKGFVESTDNFRVTQYQLGEKVPIGTVLIPGVSAKKIRDLHPIKIATGNGWLHFKTEKGTIISCRTFNETFVPTKNILKKENEVTNLHFPEEALEVLDRAQIFASRKAETDENIEITLSKKKLTFKSSSETGWFEEDLEIKYKGKDVVFNITPYLLRGILTQNLDCTIYSDKLRFEGDDWVYVTALRTV